MADPCLEDGRDRRAARKPFPCRLPIQPPGGALAQPEAGELDRVGASLAVAADGLQFADGLHLFVMRLAEPSCVARTAAVRDNAGRWDLCPWAPSGDLRSLRALHHVPPEVKRGGRAAPSGPI